jgi:hypothetical protein
MRQVKTSIYLITIHKQLPGSANKPEKYLVHILFLIHIFPNHGNFSVH